MHNKFIIVIIFLLFGLSINFLYAQSFTSSIQPVPLSIKNKMRDVTWHSNCPITLNDLSYVKLTYWGFDDKPHQGALIVNKHLALEIVDIFKKLYQQHFPIYQMRPMFKFQGNDEASMNANNTSGFNCRMITGTKLVFSEHAFGRAVDINPIQNPYVKNKIILPKSSKLYLNRKQNKKGMINQSSQIYKAFREFGWHWGGNWHNLKDYQHFEKPLD